MGLIGLLKLVRADRALFTVLAILFTTMYIDRNMSFISINGIILPILIQYLAFLINDILDYKADVKNSRIDRPLVTGEIRVDQAYLLMYILIILILLLLYLSDRYVIIFNLIFLVVSIVYDLYAKRIALVGNILIALTMVAPILYPYLFYNEMYNYRDGFLELYMYAIFLFGISRELVKSIEDVEGDKQEGINTLPVVIGIENTKILTIILLKIYLITIIIGASYLNNILAITIILFIVIFTIYLNIRLALANEKRTFRDIHEKMRLIMFTGILILAVLSLT